MTLLLHQHSYLAARLAQFALHLKDAKVSSADIYKCRQSARQIPSQPSEVLLAGEAYGGFRPTLDLLGEGEAALKFMPAPDLCLVIALVVAGSGLLLAPAQACMLLLLCTQHWQLAPLLPVAQCHRRGDLAANGRCKQRCQSGDSVLEVKTSIQGHESATEWLPKTQIHSQDSLRYGAAACDWGWVLYLLEQAAGEQLLRWLG